MQIKDLLDSSYPDFIGHINEINVPPNGVATVKYWIEKSNIDHTSFVFDFACSTGFNSRCANFFTNCEGVGADISEIAIKTATSETRKDNKHDKLKFVVEDVVNGRTIGKNFTHILAGCNFAFVQEKHRALDVVYDMLLPRGKVCTSDFFYTKEPPDDLLSKVFGVLGWLPSKDWTKEFWNEFYGNKFDLVSEKIIVLERFSDQAIEKSVVEMLTPFVQRNTDITDREIQAVFDKYVNSRKILNNHRSYQSVAVTVWEKKV